MNVAAFVLLAAMLAAYVMLDGYDLGTGVLHPFFSRDERSRAAAFAAINPFWNGNEVFLIAAGAALFALFPRAYAAAFSGFYLPLIVVLWLLMARGMSIELRGHYASPLWRGFWDTTFFGASALLAFVFGVAIGNVIRGVPLDARGYFQGTFAFMLNGYAVGVGVLALLALAMHGAAFLWMRAPADLQPRARRLVRVLWPIVGAVYIAMTIATAFVHHVGPDAALWIAPALSILSLVAVPAANSGVRALAATSFFLVTLMATVAATIFPSLLPAFPSGEGLTIYNAAPGAYSVGTAFTALVIGLGAVLAYGTIAAVRLLRASEEESNTAVR